MFNPLGSEVIMGPLRCFDALIFVLISATYNILLANMYLFLYSAQTVLQYYVTKMDVHVCIF